MPDLLFELTCEELPPRDVEGASRSLAAALATALTEADLPAAGVDVTWTPRRITVFATGLAARSPDREEEVSGPPESIAFDADGNPTRAAEGFAKKNGVDVAALERRDGRLFATVRTAGRPAAEILAALLPDLPARATWKKSMRWNAPAVFARPIRGVVALLGADVVSCTVAGCATGRVTRGHPFLTSDPVRLDDADRAGYVAALRAACVLADAAERRAEVERLVRAAAPGADVQDDLLDEVTNLVEWPSALVGAFSTAYLELPPRLLTTTMAHHQRFFPIRGDDGALEARFVAVLDRPASSAEACRPGFERVLVPRLHDASFFRDEDRKRALADRLPALENVLYHRKLGTLRDKATRLDALARALAAHLGLDAAAQAAAGRAGLLMKCDLVTHLVGEFPELQGYVGGQYAAADGEPPAVCAAIESQYRHRFDEGDTLPAEAVAACLGEHLDTLCQFGTRVGLPKGSTDPFGVRRAALSVLELAERFRPDLDLGAAVELAGGDADVLAYLRKRLFQRLRDEGARPDHLQAASDAVSVADLRRVVGDLVALEEHASFGRLLEVAERCRNITAKAGVEPGAIDRALLAETAEYQLFDAWLRVRSELPAAPAPLRASDVARLADALAEPLHTFFEQVFVNAEDAAVRANRLSLLGQIDAALLRFADLCRVVPGASSA